MGHKKGFAAFDLVFVVTLLGLVASMVVPRWDGISHAYHVKVDKMYCESVAVQLRLKALSDELDGPDSFSKPLTKDVLGMEVYKPSCKDCNSSFWYYYGPKKLGSDDYVIMVYINDTNKVKGHTYSEIINNSEGEIVYYQKDLN